MTLSLPDGWSLTSLLLHHEAGIDRNDQKPFAPMIMVQQRLDAPDLSPKEAQAKDVVTLEAELPNFVLKKSGMDNDTQLPTLEFDYDAEGHELTQAVIYVTSSKKLFTVTLTSKRAQFDALKATAVAVAKQKLT